MGRSKQSKQRIDLIVYMVLACWSSLDDKTDVHEQSKSEYLKCKG